MHRPCYWNLLVQSQTFEIGAQRIRTANVWLAAVHRPVFHRLGHLADTRRSRGMKIDKGIAMPTRLASLRSAISKAVASMSIGDSIGSLSEKQRDTAFSSARRIGFSIASRKINGEGYRIWRTK